MVRMLADCLHGLDALGPGGLLALTGTLFLAGLAGGLTHCATMCAPFVLAQSAAIAGEAARGGTLRRLAGAALLPYQAGRMIGYAMLGALAGGAAGLVVLASGLRWLLAALLVLAAVLMLAQASGRLAALLPRLPRLAPRLPAMAERRIGGLLAAPTGGRGLLLGLLLSALPCGLLYGALAVAAASGSALAGALGMASFVLGTAPPLTGVAMLGRLFGRRRGPLARSAGAAIFALNGVVLLGLAARALGGTL
jgi:sulfite exporter TauE/SafE